MTSIASQGNAVNLNYSGIALRFITAMMIATKKMKTVRCDILQ